MAEPGTLQELVFRMVSDGELTAEQAMAFIRRSRGLAPQTAATQPATEPSRDIAVIGMAGRFGDAPDLDAYWRMIEAGRHCLVEMPQRRWPTVAGKRRHGGFLPDEDRFDPLFFRISPTEAAMMDPQQRLFLETAYHALEDSGYAPEQLSGKRCGVFVGAGAGDYAQRFRDLGMESNPLGLMGNVTSILAARISYFLNLKGPSVALDTACSSSLVAVHLACESLISGTTDMALAGGVAVISTPQFIVAATEGGMLSPNDRCATFDAAADGFVCGEGSGVVVLKRLADALRDGDAIAGVIRGSGINQDGRTNGITAPSAPSQAALEVEVYRRAGIDPATISYVEAHGTGTPLGDPIEVEALTSAFRRFTDRTGFCALGSVKTNIGHALTAAGIAGLLKLLLMLRHKRIPPLVGFTHANPRIDFAATPFVLPTKAEPWEAHSPRRAAVSSFGFSGTNAHIVVEEPPPAPRRAPADGPFLFVLSGRSEEARRARATALEAHLAGAAPDLRDVAFTLAAGREHYPHRLAVVASDAAELRAALQAWLAGERSPNVLAGEARPEGPGPALTALGEQMAQHAPDLKALRILADLYVQGASFDWATLPGTAGGRRCSLPGYPFERVACNIATAKEQAALMDRAHPARLMSPSAQDARGPLSDTLADLETALAARPSPDLTDQAAAFQSIEAWGRRALVGAYAAMALFDRHVYTIAGLRKAAGIVAAKQRLHDALVDMLVREEVLKREGDLLRVRGTAPEAQDLADERRRLTEAAPELAPFLALLARCIECLPDVLTGRMTPTEVLFPDGRMDLVEPIYQGSRLSEHFNGLLADAVSTLAARLGHPACILEIGAGTGGATVGILAALAGTDSVAAYHYTDISRGFVQLGQQRFGAQHGFMQFATLDIERDPLEQGFGAGQFDIVVASNVLHASHDIARAAGHAATLVAPGGVLLLNEVTALQDYATLTFGLTDGWWAFEDAQRRIPNAPLLDVAGWRGVLEAAGFPRLAAFGLPGEVREQASQSVLAAVREGTISRPERSEGPEANPTGVLSGGREVLRSAQDDGGEPSSLADIVASEVAAALSIPVDQLDRRGRFMDFGIDSILGGQVVARLNAALGLKLRPTVLFDHPSVRDLARHIEREHGGALGARLSRAAHAATQTVEGAALESRAPSEDSPGEDRRIAIVGLSARFADCPDVHAFRAMLAEGRSGITEVPADRWSADAGSLPDGVKSESAFLRWGGFLKDAADFDPLFFRISGKEAELTDPQHRVFLTEAWRALEDAGYGERELDGRRCGVFVGAYGGDYTHRMTDIGIVPEAFAFMGNAAAILSARIAYVLNLKGPSLAVDTACSSSLTAIHLACRSLLDGECDMALAGGVFLTTTMGFNTAAAKAGMLSPAGACKTFDADADGFVPGEGAGVVVLKPYAKALADGDHIEAVILATAMNQDGKTNGITAPSPESQGALEVEVYEKAGISPEAISYVEAHGTGTKLGDPIEIEGLTRAFRHWTDRTGFCAIGSVKTNIGHAAHAAGIAGLLKVVLSLRHRTLFPSLNFRSENPELRLAETPFVVNTTLRPWETGGKPRLGAVSSFGFSGTNVHILLAEAEPLPARAASSEPCLIAISARGKAALARRLSDLRGWLDANSADLRDIARTLSAGRCHFEHRWAAVVATQADLQAALGGNATGVIDMTRGRHPALLAAAEDYLRTGEIAEMVIPAAGRRISLPTYPFEMRRYWLDAPAAVVRVAGSAALQSRSGDAENRRKSGSGEPRSRHDARATYFAPDWALAPLSSATLRGPVWIVGDGGVGALVARSLRAAGLRVSELAGDLADVAPVKQREGVPETILDLRGLEGGNATDATQLQGLFALAQALFTERTRILVVHRGQPILESVQAFRRSLHFDGATVDLRTLGFTGALPPVEALAAHIATELGAPREAETEVAIRDGSRFVRRMVAAEPARGAEVALRRGGHFVLTGGGGVLAGLFARRLAALTDGRITLLGRSPATEAVRATLDAVGAGIYRQVDVTNETALTAVLAEVRRTHGPIHGVIHAAGVPGGALFRNADWAGMAACLVPKVAGTVALDRALGEESLDFFVLFSSLAGELGDFGQGSYAAANSFCDRFAAWRETERIAGRRHGRTVALGWPLWREGRGVLSAEGEKIYLATAGMPYLETETGWQAFLDSLAMDAPQLAVVPGDRSAAVALFTPPIAGTAARPAAAVRARPQVAAAVAPVAVGDDLVPAIRRNLAAMISRLLKIDEELLAPEAGLADFGFDSIALKEFGAQLSDEYGVSISPAVFFARGTIDALSNYLAQTYPAEAAVRHAAPSRHPDRSEAEPSGVEGPAHATSPEMNRSVEFASLRSGRRDADSGAIAVIGMSGRFPGSPDLAAFWRNLEAETDLVGRLPEGRTLAAQTPYDSDALRGGFLDRIDTFDAGFFRISPREACFLDPQHRLAIETVYHCVEDAGLRIGALAGKPVGVFFGAQVNEYGAIIPDRDIARAQIALGNIATMLPNRISYLFDLRGPSEAVDTACSSSMVAVHRAIRALQAGECDMALAGGVSLVLTAESIVSTAELGVVSPDGRCHTFDARANGYVKGEGVGVVLLKPLAQAQADGDPIHAVILGSSANHGGRAHSLTAPNGTAQAALVAAAIRQAGVPSDTIGYVEAHGTGTELGDPVEVMALKEGFAVTAVPGSVQRRDCRLGTVKTNIGHLEPASGIAGLIKTVLALKHRTLPASLHFQQLNPLIDFSGTSFSVADRTRPWEPLRDGDGRALPRRAGVSSFGLGGSNVHVVLQESPAVPETGAAPRPELLMVSARDQDRLTDLLCSLADFASREPGISAADVAHTLVVGREPMTARAAVLWRPGQSLAERFQLAAEASAGTAEPDDVWIGTVARQALGRDDAASARQFLADLAASGQLGRLGALWVVGTELPAAITTGRRISLPGYPFARTRYWCDREVSAPPAAPRRTAASVVTPAPMVPAAPVPLPVQREAPPRPAAPSISGRSLAEVRGVVRRLLAQALYLEEAQLDDRAGFADLGLDSILAVELTKSLNDELGTQLQATRLYDYANVVELAAHLHESLMQPEEAPAVDPVASPAVAFLMEQLAAIGATGLGARTPLEAIGLQPAQAKALLSGLNERFGCGLSEADVGRCPDLGRLAALIESRTRGGDKQVAAPTATPVPPAPTAGPPLAEVRGTVRRLLAQALYLEEAQLDDRAGFADLGLDSILAVELTKSLNDELGTQLQATRLYDHANVVELAAHLHESLSQPAEAPSVDPVASPGVAFLMDQLAAIGATGLTARTPLEAIGLQPAQAKSLLNGLNERFGCGLSEADVGRCPDLGRLAALIETRTGGGGSAPLERKPEPMMSAAVASAVEMRAPAPPVVKIEPTAAAAAPAALRHAERSVVAETTDVTTAEVAIIGYACRLPGAPDAAAFWDRLCSGEVAVTPYPGEAWRQADYEQALRSVGSDTTPWGGYLDGVDRFDPAFFNIPADQARAMDPQQRLFLQVAWHALEMAGQTRAMLDGAECGVFVGGGPSDYGRVLESQGSSVDGQTLLGNISSIMAARIAYFLNLRGPCVAMDTACSSGLVALHAAWRSILDGECESAIVGGVSLLLTPQMHVLTGAGGMLSAVGQCQTFDDSADGFVPAEGIVALVLKRLDRALADGDPIQGVVRGVGVNQNGTTAGIAAPSARAQARLLGRLYNDCSIPASEIGLVEVHGTGTKIGDALEFDALRQVFGVAGARPGATVLSSAKPVIGHSFAASGLASVVKLLLALRHRVIPATRAPRRLNQHMLLQGSPFRIGTAQEPWPEPASGRRLAAATSYGLSGTNAHVVLAEPPTAATGAAARLDRHLVVVSARDAAALQRQLDALRVAISHEAPPLGDIAYTLGARRNHFAVRAAFVVRDIADLSAQLARGPGALPADAPAALRAMAEAWLAGGEVDWTDLYPQGRVCDLPGYSFATERYWPGTAPRAAVATPADAPADEGTLSRLTAIFAQVLRADAAVVTPDTPFDVMGLDSAAAVEIMKTAEAAFGVALRVIALWDHPTIRSLAAFIEDQPPAPPSSANSLAWAGRTADGRHDPVVPIRTGGDGQPSFWVHGGPGDVNWVVELARHLPADRPVYGLEAAGLDGVEPPLPSVEAMAAHYVEATLRTQPKGPYVLGGYSAGGAIAFEMARRMIEAGHTVERLVLLDCNAPGNDAVTDMQAGYGPGYVYLVVGNWFGARWGTARSLVLSDLAGLDKPAMLERVLDHLFEHLTPPLPREAVRRQIEALDRIGWRVGDALRAYRAEPIAASLEVLLFECRDGMAGGANPLGLPVDAAGETYREGWDALFSTPVTRIAMACDHFALLKGEAGRTVGERIAGRDDGRARIAGVVLGLVREILPDAPPELVVPERSMAELGATSIDRVEVATLAMESLGLRIPNGELASVNSIGDLIDVLHRHAAQ
ncbi:MAG: KR domain-containing protein [Bauldia sp.]|nr:KR domain-containing protein [Bauldia sp.]